MNEDAVIEAAKHELNKSSSLMRKAGKRLSDLKSPSFDDQPKAVSFDNHVEAALARRIDAQDELTDIIAAINLCDQQCKQVLFDLYIDPNDNSNIEVMINTNRTERTFYRLERRALYQFAEGFRYGELFETAREMAEKWQESGSKLAE